MTAWSPFRNSSFETVFKDSYTLIHDNVPPLLLLLGIAFSGKRRLRHAFVLYTSTYLSVADCLHIVIAEARKVPQFVSFDRGLDRIPSLNRVKPFGRSRDMSLIRCMVGTPISSIMRCRIDPHAVISAVQTQERLRPHVRSRADSTPAHSRRQ